MKPYKKRLSAEIASHLPKLKTAVVALSGGPDSVFLARLMIELLGAENIILAHFDHRLRADSADDAHFCERFAKQHDCRFFTEQWSEPAASEEKARNVRLAFLETVLKQTNADAILYGTHFDDNTETIIFRFLRGSGIHGLRGIQPFDNKRRFLRPMLHIRKSEILAYLAENKIEYCIDPTNFESNFTRNFIRNDLIPKITERFPDFANNLHRQAQLFTIQNEFLQSRADRFLTSQKPGHISRLEFTSLHKAEQLEVIRKIFAGKGLSFEQAEAICGFLHDSASGKQKSLLGVTLRAYSEFVFYEG
jgi:tRNA(Ile)-lysidine synthase